MTDDLHEFLGGATPLGWIEAALANQELMLLDHANCEKKAAGTAFQLMFRYTDKPDLQHRMSRLAREELRHFEQVLTLIRRRGIALRQVSSSRYAAGLRELARNHEPSAWPTRWSSAPSSRRARASASRCWCRTSTRSSAGSTTAC